jgi:hypothetical protein
VLISIATNFFGFLFFSFLLWLRLKEDYSREEIFSLGFSVVFGMTLGFFLAKYFVPGFWFWGEVAGSGLGFALFLIRYHPRFYETLEALIFGFLAWLEIFWLAVFLKTPATPAFLATLLIICLLILFGLFEANYKDFNWYRSGRIGFSGLTCAAIFFLSRAAIASFFPTLLSFANGFEVYLSGSCAFFFFLLVYNLSRKTP